MLLTRYVIFAFDIHFLLNNLQVSTVKKSIWTLDVYTLFEKHECRDPDTNKVETGQSENTLERMELVVHWKFAFPSSCGIGKPAAVFTATKF